MHSQLIQDFGEFLLEAKKTGRRQLPFYQNWVEAAYQHAGADRSQPLPAGAETAFLGDLQRGHEPWQVKQARFALSLYRYFLETHQNQAEVKGARGAE